MSSGGRSGSSYNANDLKAIRQEAAERLEHRRLDAEINSLLQQRLSDVNDRDVVKINDRLNKIEECLGGDVDGLDRLTYGGSVAKHTFVDGLSDVDALVHIQGESAQKPPAQLRDEIKAALDARLPHGQVDEITIGRMAVTVRYRDGVEIQLVPAVKRAGDRVAVSDASGRDWSNAIDARAFSDRLTRTNQRQGGMVVPIIKLAKAILDNELGDGAPSGYHVEALAVDAFARYDGPRTYKSMLTHFMQSATEAVLTPTGDVTGQSAGIDASLGGADSTERRELSRRIGDIARVTSSTSSVERWRRLVD